MSTSAITNQKSHHPNTNKDCVLSKKINDEKDVIYFRTQSSAFKNILVYVDALCEFIKGTGNRVLNHKYQLKDSNFKLCAEFIEKLGIFCDETDLNSAKSTATLRFGHVAFRDWFDRMTDLSGEFVNNKLAELEDTQLRAELYNYLIDSFGNKMRIDYGTGHELNFIIFTMGLFYLVPETKQSGDFVQTINSENLKRYVSQYGCDILALFAHSYLRLCRRLQLKFRLEPAGSRGVYNMDDFQFLPFLFGTAQLSGIKHISCKQFYEFDQVDMFKNDYIFFEAVDFILNNKRGPFNEHSYTLWNFTGLGSWDNIFHRIKNKFTDDILRPFPIVQHFLFGRYILNWDRQHDIEAQV